MMQTLTLPQCVEVPQKHAVQMKIVPELTSVIRQAHIFVFYAQMLVLLIVLMMDSV
jgi:hypothetical protein